MSKFFLMDIWFETLLKFTFFIQMRKANEELNNKGSYTREFINQRQGEAGVIFQKF